MGTVLSYCGVALLIAGTILFIVIAGAWMVLEFKRLFMKRNNEDEES